MESLVNAALCDDHDGADWRLAGLEPAPRLVERNGHQLFVDALIHG